MNILQDIYWLSGLSRYRQVFLFGLILSGSSYFLTDVISWLHALMFTFSKGFLYLMVLPFAIKRKTNPLILLVLGLLPFITLFLVGLPSSFSSSFSYYPNNAIDELQFKAVWLLIGLLPALALFMVAILTKNGSLFKSIQKIQYLGQQKTELSRFTLLFNVIVAIYLYSQVAGDLPLISYFSRVLFYSLSWYFLFIGFFRVRVGVFNYQASLVLLGLHTIIVFASGGRFSAIWLVLLFLIGFYLSSENQVRSTLKWQLIWVVPLGIFVVGAIGLIRQDIGRGNFSIITEGNRLSEMSSQMVIAFDKFLTDDDFRQEIYDEMSSRTKGGGALQRVLLYSPDKIEYRSWDNIGNEVGAVFQVAALQAGGFDLGSLSSVRSQNVEKQLSTAAANRYGFHVTEGHSVEWPVVADGYSRFGMIGAVSYTLIFVVWLLFMFGIMRKIFSSPLALMVLLLTYGSIAFNGYGSEPLYEVIRTTILYSIPVSIILSFFARSNNRKNTVYA